MNRRLFEDLVVSAPASPLAPARAALLPFSIALHGGALALALLVPVLRPGEMPAPAFQRPIWEVPRVAASAADPSRDTRCASPGSPPARAGGPRGARGHAARSCPGPPVA